MKKAAAVIVATMVFSLFSEAGMAPQIVQAATYQKTVKNKSVKKPKVLVRADEVKVFSIKVKEVDKQIQEEETKQTENSADTQIPAEERAQQEEETTEITIGTHHTTSIYLKFLTLKLRNIHFGFTCNLKTF